VFRRSIGTHCGFGNFFKESMNIARNIWYTIQDAAKFFLVLVVVFSLANCKSRHQSNANAMFEVLDDTKTGLHFSNKLTPTQDFNMFNYMYFYNGAGVGAGDFK